MCAAVIPHGDVPSHRLLGLYRAMFWVCWRVPSVARVLPSYPWHLHEISQIPVPKHFLCLTRSWQWTTPLFLRGTIFRSQDCSCSFMFRLSGLLGVPFSRQRTTILGHQKGHGHGDGRALSSDCHKQRQLRWSIRRCSRQPQVPWWKINSKLKEVVPNMIINDHQWKLMNMMFFGGFYLVFVGQPRSLNIGCRWSTMPMLTSRWAFRAGFDATRQLRPHGIPWHPMAARRGSRLKSRWGFFGAPWEIMGDIIDISLSLSFFLVCILISCLVTYAILCFCLFFVWIRETNKRHSTNSDSDCLPVQVGSCSPFLPPFDAPRNTPLPTFTWQTWL